MNVDLDHKIRPYVYNFFVDQERPPTASETGAALHLSPETVEVAFRRMAEAHILVLEPDKPEIRFAEPFCAVPTPFRVHTAAHAYWGTCAWDALGIPAALHTAAKIVSTCPDCNKPLKLTVENGNLYGNNEVIHFAIPARQWWADIFFT